MYINRLIESHLNQFFSAPHPKGLVLSGVVGCGKTTVIQHFLKSRPKNEFVAQYTCDDTVFRSAIGLDSKYLYKELSAKTTGPIFLFIDEVQKSEAVFDAIKYAFDHMKLQFIVSGSNPDFLNTTAKKRLQRRADFFMMAPLSLSEILISSNEFPKTLIDQFETLLFEGELGKQVEVKMNSSIEKNILEYFSYGGLPRSYLSKNLNDKLIEIKLVVERGFESLSKNNFNLSDQIIVEMANLHSKEFTYQGIFQKTQERNREVINQYIDQLINHGYLLKKKPKILNTNRTSYLSNYSWIDPGINNQGP